MARNPGRIRVHGRPFACPSEHGVDHRQQRTPPQFLPGHESDPSVLRSYLSTAAAAIAFGGRDRRETDSKARRPIDLMPNAEDLPRMPRSGTNWSAENDRSINSPNPSLFFAYMETILRVPASTKCTQPNDLDQSVLCVHGDAPAASFQQPCYHWLAFQLLVDGVRLHPASTVRQVRPPALYTCLFRQ